MVEDDHLARRAFLWAVLCVGDLCVCKREGMDSHPCNFLFGHDVCGCVHYPGGRNRGPARDPSFAACVGIEFALVVDPFISYTSVAKGTSIFTRCYTNYNSFARCCANDQWLIKQSLQRATEVGQL